MPSKLTVVISQGQSANPARRKLEEDLVAALLFEPGIEVTVVPNLYDLAPDGTGMLCLQGIVGEMVVVAWLYPRAAHWILARNQVKGRVGAVLLTAADEGEDDEPRSAESPPAAAEDAAASTLGQLERDVPSRRIYCLDFRAADSGGPFVEEIRRIAHEASVQTVQLGGLSIAPPKSTNGKSAAAAPLAPVESPAAPVASAAPQPTIVAEETNRRWYPVIDFGRCTNCMECIDFCLFGVYGVDRFEAILVEQPDNCRKGCPACSRVCPENAIIFPQHKSPSIAGSPTGEAGGFKIDLSALFGAPDAIDQAVRERDVELVAAGRGAVGHAVGIPKRQTGAAPGAKDELDALIDQLDDLDL